jgi:DNA-binding winged helix-turn-helix (wHTH) protein
LKNSYRFGPFRLDPAERRLVRDGSAIALTPKAFDLLTALVENAGHLMKKSDLLERLWPGVFVEEVNLAQNVSAVRRALGGDAKESFIQTVAGVGYRFTAAVETFDASARQPADARHRLIVLPFRMLKPDEDTAFLSFSLPDALTASLSGLESLVVRSSLIAARLGDYPPDLGRIRSEATVDLVLSGTLLRGGDQLRVAVELTDTAAGTVMWSHAEQAPLGDLFQLQDRIVERIITLLELRLTARERQRLERDAPSNAKGYEFYLRANQMAHGARGYSNVQTWHLARDMYLQSVSDDPGFAPAWAALARVYRMMGKYSGEDSALHFRQAETAIARALELNPDQSSAHMLQAQIETDLGRAADAMVRLIRHARQNGRSPEVFAGLCYACRYCGLLEESLAADQRARQLDPTLVTSVVHTHFVLGNDTRVLELLRPASFGYTGLIALVRLGRSREALDAARLHEETAPEPFRAFLRSTRELIEGRSAESARSIAEAVRGIPDPEAVFYAARHLAYLGERDRSLEALAEAVASGYFGLAAGHQDRWFDNVRDAATFVRLLDRSRRGQLAAGGAYQRAGGADVLS